MPKFTWEAKARTGQVQKGEMEAPNEQAVAAQLRRQGMMPSKIVPAGKGLNLEIRLPKLGGNVKTKDLVVFTRQFSTMIDAGLPLVQCLDILAKQQPKEKFQKALISIKESVESGSTFAASLEKHPDVFDELYVNLVAAAEIGGILDVILNRLAAYIEKALSLKKKIKSAMTYPVTVVGVAFVVIAVILIFVIPSFEKMFADFGSELPAPTQMVINMSNFAKSNVLFIGAGIAAMIFGFKRYYKTESGRGRMDAFALKLPIFGVLIRKVAVAKFTRTMGTMMSSGVPILDALDIVAKTAGNRVVEKAIYKVKQSISEGKTIAEPLEKSGVFPSMVCQMIGVGERSGALDVMLNKVADFYDDEVDSAVDGLTSMLEPLLMLFLGTTVGGLVIAMYLPVFKLAGTVSG